MTRAAQGRSGGFRYWLPMGSEIDASTQKRLAVVFGLWLAVALIYWPSSLALDGVWRGKGEFNHGYPVLLVSLWLVVQSRGRLAATALRPAPAALVLTLVLSALWLWFWRAAIQDLHLLLIPLVLLTALAAALGWGAARELLFPVSYLYFAMPAWAHLTGVLQALSAKANAFLMWLAGVPAFMQGNFIELPGGTIEIAGGCSGLHGFMVGLALAALYGQVSRDSIPRRLTWLGLMGLFALIANWVRIFVVTLAAYESDMHSSLITNHKWLGLLLFAFAVGGFLLLGEHLRASWNRRRGPGESAREGGFGGPNGALNLRRAAAAVMCLGILPALSYGMGFPLAQSRGSVSIAWPAAPRAWRGPDPVLAGDWAPQFLNPSAEGLRRYVGPDGWPIEVFLVAYRTQTQNAKLLGYRNTLLGVHDLQARSERTVEDAAKGRWRETVAVDPMGVRSLLWSRYRIGRRHFVRGRLAQLWYGLAAVMASRPPVSLLTALRAVCHSDCASARMRLGSAAAELEPVVRLAASPR